MIKKREDNNDLKEACCKVAHDVIAERGVEALSLREVARRLGVSHQAPYRHYPSRDHLLAEVMRRCFEGFARELDARERFDTAQDDLGSLGLAYLNYAARHPLEYRLMFNTPWPDTAEFPALIKDALHAFDILRLVLQRLHSNNAAGREAVDLDAMFIWATMHGLASIAQSNVMTHLKLPATVLSNTPSHAMNMIASAMQHRPR